MRKELRLIGLPWHCNDFAAEDLETVTTFQAEVTSRVVTEKMVVGGHLQGTTGVPSCRREVFQTGTRPSPGSDSTRMPQKAEKVRCEGLSLIPARGRISPRRSRRTRRRGFNLVFLRVLRALRGEISGLVAVAPSSHGRRRTSVPTDTARGGRPSQHRRQCLFSGSRQPRRHSLPRPLLTTSRLPPHGLEPATGGTRQCQT